VHLDDTELVLLQTLVVLLLFVPGFVLSILLFRCLRMSSRSGLLLSHVLILGAIVCFYMFFPRYVHVENVVLFLFVSSLGIFLGKSVAFKVTKAK
jgi:hypothetical protein